MLVRNLALGLLVGSSALVFAQSPAPASAPRQIPALHTLILTSPAFTDGTVIPEKYASVKGQKSVSPALSWTGAPAGTESFVITIIDEEFAFSGKSQPFYHWILFNVPGTATSLPEGLPTEKELPDGSIQPQNFRWVGYMGMGAPTAGERHHYIFRVTALDTKLPLGPDASPQDMANAMDGHILDRGLLVGTYRKPK